VQETPADIEVTSEPVTNELTNGNASNVVAELYSALPTTEDSQSDAPTTTSIDVTGSGDLSVGDNVTTGDEHGNGDITATVVTPPTSSAPPPNDIVTGDITDSDEELMSTKSAGKDDNDWVMVERPSLTSDDQSLDSVDSIVDDEVLTNTVTMETTDQEPEEVEMTDVAMDVVDNDKHITTEIVEHDKCFTVDHSKQDEASLLLSDAVANQDGGGSTADDEAEDDDDVDTKDWWRSKGPSTTTSSVVTKQQPKWTSLKFTRQLKSRWGMTSSSPAVTTTVNKEPPKANTSPVMTSKTNELSTWFPEDDDHKKPVFPSAGEIAEAKQLEEKMAAEAAAKKAKKLSPIISDHGDKKQQGDTQQQTQQGDTQQQTQQGDTQQQTQQGDTQQQDDTQQQQQQGDAQQQQGDTQQWTQQQQETQHKQDTSQQKQQQPEDMKDTQPSSDQLSSVTNNGE